MAVNSAVITLCKSNTTTICCSMATAKECNLKRCFTYINVGENRKIITFSDKHNRNNFCFALNVTKQETTESLLVLQKIRQ